MSEDESMTCWASYVIYGDPSVVFFNHQPMEKTFVENKIHFKESRKRAKQTTTDEQHINKASTNISKRNNSLYCIICGFILMIIAISCFVYYVIPKETPSDDWTSKPLTLAVVVHDSLEKAINQSKDFFVASVIESQIKQYYPRVTLVDRSRMKVILDEYALWKSNWIDKKEKVHAGLLPVRLFLMLYVDTSDLDPFVVMHLEDTETGRVNEIFHEPLVNNELMLDQKERISKSLLEQLKTLYPLRGMISDTHNGNGILNIGHKIGVRVGQCFKIINQKNKVTVFSVQSNSSSVTLINKNVKLKKGYRVEAIF